MRAAVLILALLLAPTVAAAQSAPDMAQSRALFEEGTAAYKLGNFEVALEKYEAAYKLYPAPQFLFNIAQCHFQLQTWERAIFFFEGYLREVPAATNRALVEDLIKEARQRADAQREADRKKLDLERERLELERRMKEREAAERERRLALETRSVEAPPERPVYKRWWFWGLVGGAVAGIAVTTAVTWGETRTVLPEGSLGTWDRR